MCLVVDEEKQNTDGGKRRRISMATEPGTEKDVLPPRHVVPVPSVPYGHVRHKPRGPSQTEAPNNINYDFDNGCNSNLP